MTYEKYFLDATKSGHDRLKILNRLYNQQTLANLAAAGLRPGMRILEVGTGAGIMTRALAEVVGPSGSVLSVDRSPEQTKAFLEQDAPDNIELRPLALSELGQLDTQFDMVFSRWILLHLTDPKEGVLSMERCLNKGGILALEDCVTSTAFCYPRYEPFDYFISSWLEVGRREYITPDAGDRLAELLDATGFSVQSLAYNHPVLTSPEERCLPALSLLESRDIHVKHGIFSERNVHAIVKDLEDLAHSRHTMGFVRNTFVAGQKRE